MDKALCFECCHLNENTNSGVVTFSDAHKPKSRHEPHCKDKETDELHDSPEYQVTQLARNQIRTCLEQYLRLYKGFV